MLAALIGICAVALAAPGAALAHGNLDQYLDGDAGCNTFNFPASVTGAGGQRQQFVPSGASLSSVGLCVSSASAGAALTVIIRDANGSAIGGGSSLQTTPPESLGTAPAYVHVDFLQPVSVTPGALHSIEIGVGTTVTWYGTAPGADLYCAGAPNTSAVGDFAFRAYLADAAAGPAGCPEPTPTPVPPTPTRTNTPHATSTPAPDETPAPGASPTASAVAGTVAEATAPSGVVQAGPDAAPEGSARQPSGGGAGASGLPASGAPGRDAPARDLAIGLLSSAGALAVVAGLALRRRPRLRR